MIYSGQQLSAQSAIRQRRYRTLHEIANTDKPKASYLSKLYNKPLFSKPIFWAFISYIFAARKRIAISFSS